MESVGTIERQSTSAFFYDLFQNQGNQPRSSLILGQTGTGQPGLAAAWAATCAAWQSIALSITTGGLPSDLEATTIQVRPDDAVNIFDLVVDPTSPGWMHLQTTIVRDLLSTLLGHPSRSPEGKEQIISRDFSVQERDFLSRAILALYEQVALDASFTAMPILSDLIAKLETFHEDEAKLLAKDLRVFCFGTTEANAPLTTEGVRFNRPTTVNWNGDDFTIYDLQYIPERHHPFFLVAVIGVFRRLMHAPDQERRPRLLSLPIIQIPAIMQMVADMSKVARAYRVALVIQGANPSTFLDTLPGQTIWANTRIKLVFDLPPQEMERVATNIEGLPPDGVEQIRQAGNGLAVVDTEVVLLVEENQAG